MSETHPVLHFDFRPGASVRPGAGHTSASVGPLTFQQPIEVISALRLEDVAPALARVESAALEGRWAAGFLSYEAAPAFDPAFQVKESGPLPLLWFGIFERPAHLENTDSETFPLGAPVPAQVPAEDANFDLGEWTPDVDAPEYDRCIGVIRDGIRDGAVYQVNYTLRLRAPFTGDPLALHRCLCAAQGSSYSAYLDLGRFRILSASPELFFERSGSEITCRPMKGTARRGRWKEEDEEASRRLLASEKDRAENAMIVDLVRNDLGRISEIGSVRARDIFKLETYRTVHQMTSTIESTVREGGTLLDLFRSVFPCGSVTGAPKIASTGFITDLERAPRGVYCGAVGYVAPGGDCVFNVPIRTVVVDREQEEAEYGVGGGITWDSSPDEEYAEVLAKAEILRAEWPEFSLLETFRSGGLSPVRLAAHLERMEASAVYFGFRFSASEVQATIDRALAEAGNAHARAAGAGTGGEGTTGEGTDGTTDSWRIRALSDEQGRVSVEVSPCDPPGSTYSLRESPGAARAPGSTAPRPIGFASRPVSSSDPFLFHKTTHRAAYESRAAEHPDLFDVLLVNEDGYVTEFTCGNVVAEIEGAEWTPPRECGLLAGIFRGELLAEGRIQERLLTPTDVRGASRLWLINSVREWVGVRLVE